MSDSPSPVPPSASGADWRDSVQQSYRNTEVREIAKVLAALEPGATASSKLRLAMQFEDVIFKAATDLGDYRKKLTKRLKKLQKNYVPTQAPASSNKESTLLQLRQQYGDSIRYILKHADAAVEQMRSKHGDEKASQLKQHTDGVKTWAEDLGLTETSGATPNLNISDSQLEKLKGHLERRAENIRSHVVKLADTDQFLLETLEKTEKDMKEKPSKLLAINSRKRYEQLQRTQEVDVEALFQRSMEGIQKAIPPPTRNQRNDQRAALMHLEKMRAASTLILGWMMTPNKATLPRNVMLKSHNAAKEGIEFVTNVMKEHRKGQKDPGVTLEDAWSKTLAVPSPSIESLESPEKKQKTATKRLVTRTRILLTPGRKAPSNLLPALKRKRAILVRPEPRGEGAHLILEFEKAFVMTIYFVPLVVTLRAYDKRKSGPINKFVGSASMSPLNCGIEGEDLSVWGATGAYESLGHVVEERLRDASAHATYVLRKVFEGAVKENASDFEMEIREATALLEFLQLSRTTYIPNWEDDDQ